MSEHTLMEESNCLRSNNSHFDSCILLVITSTKIELESCSWSQIVDFEENFLIIYFYFNNFLPSYKHIKAKRSISLF